ncbi:hypothetical protein [Brevibacterium aurantiacum]|uniref:Uncharacterized protein n=1 Tax=Brevibacterium aurantiacum TaxID=273384 RepID=A0A2H1KN60_BREAU|nr:hypothetical protein [Brevibacterium aurantiacum]SMY01059.1 hypothetical protein BAURA63_03498 [Brevibacterium aurantiacum]
MASLTDYRTIADFVRTDDWAGFRKLAQTAARNGHLAILTQTYNNDTEADPAIEHTIEFLPAELAAIINTDNNGHTEEIPMGSTRSFEIFTPELPTGLFGPNTDLDLLP